MELSKAADLARELMDENGLEHLPFQFDRARTMFGQTTFIRLPGGGTRPKKISLSKVLTPHRDEADVRLTILHEIAHALAGHAAGHGRQWQSICLAIGGDGKRCGGEGAEEVKQTSKYKMVCEGGHEHGYRNRASKYVPVGEPAALPARCRDHSKAVYLVPNA